MSRKNNSWLLALGVINLICGLMHGVFEFYILDNLSIYREFLLIENLLIGFVFIYFAIGIFAGSPKTKLAVINMNISFWVIFAIVVLLFRPEVTTLNLFKEWLPVSQKLILFGFSIIALVLSLVSLRCQRTEEA